MARSVLARLDDIDLTISGIEAALDGVSFDMFSQSWTLQRAVERGLEIISEASRALPPELKAIAPDLPWADIAGIGNVLRHEYQRIEPLIIWNIVEYRFHELKAAMNQIRAMPDL